MPTPFGVLASSSPPDREAVIGFGAHLDPRPLR